MLLLQKIKDVIKVLMKKIFSSKNKAGFTLVELIIVIIILGIIAAIAVPRLIGIIERARISADRTTCRMLNTATAMYGIEKDIEQNDIFTGFSTDGERMEELVNKGFMRTIPKPQLKRAEFVWIIEEQLWVIFDGDAMMPISPLGSTFSEISAAIIDLINQKFIDTGSYGRTWGDYRYTDIGLEPSDWQSPVAHIYFKPSGSVLRISPEEGYSFIVEDMEGNIRVLSHTLNWDLIYNAQDENWYYRSISEGNIIDITTFEIQQ